jgi:DNA-binding phage protein
MEKPPAVGQDLVDWLDQQFPEKLPDPASAEAMLHDVLRKQGQREVVNHLRSLVARQESKALRTVL